MTDPYSILGVSAEADEAALRRRYLELVRQNPPEKRPAEFAEIRAAYEQLRDPAARLERQLFRIRDNESLDDILVALRARVRAARIPTQALLSLAEQ